jgi:hypothetical protein
LAGGYGRVGETLQIKAVLLWNRYVKISLRLGRYIGARRGDNSAEIVFPRALATRKSLLALLTDQ